MLRLAKFLAKTLSVRLSLFVVSAVAGLFVTALYSLSWYTKKLVKEEVVQKTTETLKSIVQNMDNTLYEVEHIARNMSWNVEHNLGDPDKMFLYSKKVLELNRDIAGCAIAFEPNYYKEKGQLFMAYYYRSTMGGGKAYGNDPIIQANSFGIGPYTEQVWYTMPLKYDKPYWTDPLKDDDHNGEPIVTYCVPIHDGKGRAVGVIGVDVTLSRLTSIANDVGITPNSYCAVLGTNGDYVVHPDVNRLKRHQNVFNLHKKPGTYQEIEKVANAMLSGQKGYAVTNINFPTPDSTKLVPTECYVYYRPFATRGWSACIVCPTGDILIGYDLFSHYFWLAIWISILLFLVACSLITRWELKPLRNLKQWAQKVSAGQFDAPIPDSDRQDEIGQLKMSLEQMQQSLSAHVTELRTLTDFLEKQGDMLRKAYEQAREAERMKIALLHNMTDQMIAPIETLIANVTILREKSWKMEPYETALLVEDILDQGHAVTLLVDHLISVSQKNTNVKEQK